MTSAEIVVETTEVCKIYTKATWENWMEKRWLSKEFVMNCIELVNAYGELATEYKQKLIEKLEGVK